MGASYRRPRVYVRFRHRGTIMRRVLDIAFVHGTEPVAVISWVKSNGAMLPDEYVHLDERKLLRSVPAGTYWYPPVIDDPRFAPPEAPVRLPDPGVASADAAQNGPGEEKA